MPADKSSKPSKPQAKPEPVRDLPARKGSPAREEQVKGGRNIIIVNS